LYLNKSQINRIYQDCKGIERVAAMTKNELTEQPKEVSKASSDKSSDGNGVTKLFVESKAEFGKIVWPTRQQLISESVAVLLMIVAVATFVYLIDALFRAIALQVFQ
jgi:preprotein translocase subunit SecE